MVACSVTLKFFGRSTKDKLKVIPTGLQKYSVIVKWRGKVGLLREARVMNVNVFTELEHSPNSINITNDWFTSHKMSHNVLLQLL